MSVKQNNRTLLSSWKEIASYLDCDMKTCRRWETQFGLPIHRIDGPSKSRVYAYKEEVDEWLKKKNNREKTEAPRIYSSRYVQASVIILLAAILSALLIFRNTVLNRRGPAVDFHFDGSKFIIVDQNNKKIGEYDTGNKNLIAESAYRSKFQTPNRKSDRQARVSIDLPLIIIEDIDNDNSPEILISMQTKTESHEGLLICLNEKGDELWDFTAGREIQYGDTGFSSDYRIMGLLTYDFNDDGFKEIIVTASYKIDFPNQIVILDSKGKVKGEYWNSGYLNRCEIADIDKDGRADLLLAGCNNEYKKACLVVFDTEDIDGGSPQDNETWASDELNRGTEKYYILFPRTDFDDATITQEAAASIEILNNDTISLVALNSQIIFNLDFNMKISEVRLSNLFQDFYRQAKFDGRVHAELDDKYRQKLETGLLYFDGTTWVSQPAKSNPWPTTSNN